MFRKLKTLLLSLTLLLSFGSAMVPLTVGAQQKDELCSGANLSLNGGGGCSKDNPGKKLNDTIATVINVISTIIAIVAVIMIIYGGFKFITSGGDSGNLASARNTILYAIIGLIIVALAQAIVQFIIKKV